ncbi:iron-sulfur cluster assembly accessory protein [Bacillaceae bacterium S4-13-58]
MVITISENASLQVKEMLKEEEGDQLHLRFGVQGGGCSGLSYKLGFDANVEEDDVTFDSNGISIVVKKEDVPIIEGTTIDFKQNMMGGGFTIDNPNAIASCGCGSSFRTATEAGSPEGC